MLKATGLYKSFGEHAVLRGVDLAVGKGEFLSIMGESGSGKSTLLSILAGNCRPDEGRVELSGRDVFALSEQELARLRRTSLGFVYQSLNLISTLNGAENILLPLYLDRADRRAGEEKMRELAAFLRIERVLDAFPETMSGGERQRVAIARALVHDPEVLFLDEPTGSLDSRATDEVLELLTRINRERGVTVVQVTHSAAAAACGTRTVTLVDGRVGER